MELKARNILTDAFAEGRLDDAILAAHEATKKKWVEEIEETLRTRQAEAKAEVKAIMDAREAEMQAALQADAIDREESQKSMEEQRLKIAQERQEVQDLRVVPWPNNRTKGSNRAPIGLQ